MVDGVTKNNASTALSCRKPLSRNEQLPRHLGSSKRLLIPQRRFDPIERCRAANSNNQPPKKANTVPMTITPRHGLLL
jgi:hypothetical protein